LCNGAIVVSAVLFEHQLGALQTLDPPQSNDDDSDYDVDL
jgi:hypothetical protein